MRFSPKTRHVSFQFGVPVLFLFTNAFLFPYDSSGGLDYIHDYLYNTKILEL